MRSCRGHGGTRRTVTWSGVAVGGGSLMPLCMTCEGEKGGCREEEAEIQKVNCSSRSRHQSPLPPFFFLRGRDLLCFKCGIFGPDERCGLMTGVCFHSSRTHPISPGLQKCLHHLGSSNQPEGCLWFPVSPPTQKTHLGLCYFAVSLLEKASSCSPCKSSKLSQMRSNCLP